MRIRIPTSLLLVCSFVLSCGEPDVQVFKEIKSIDSVIVETPDPQIILPSGEFASANKTDSSVERTKRLELPVDEFEKPVERSGIVSPSHENDVPYQHYTVDAATGSTLTYDQTGSTILIPENALVDKDGNPVTGKVDISYREFHSQKDVFFSGIPMDFEVNGETQFFETAGMIDISASQNNKEVFVKKGKEIKFKMSTDNQHKETKLYTLNKRTKKWEETGEAPVVLTPIIQKKIWGPVYKNEAYKKRVQKPIYVRIGNYYINHQETDVSKKRKLIFDIYISRNNLMRNKKNTKEFNKARLVQKASFEVLGFKRSGFKSFLAAFSDQDTKDKYGTASYTPILGDFLIDNANYPYLSITMKFNGHTETLDVKMITKFGSTEKYRKKLFNLVKDFNYSNFDGRYTLKEGSQNCVDHFDSMYVSGTEEEVNKSLVQREFAAQNFGIINCDQPHALPNEMVASARFTVNGQSINPTSMCLVDFSRNCQFIYYNSAFVKFGYNPDTQNFLFTTDAEGNVIYILPEEFKQIAQNPEMIINMRSAKIENLAKIMEQMFPAKTQKDFMI